MKLLNYGCGKRSHPDWVNVDATARGEGVLAHDLRKGIPFADRSFAVVYHQHVLEHLGRAEAEGFTRECFRMLTQGGILRVAVPDLEGIARKHLESLERAENGSAEWAANHEWMMLELYDQAVRERTGGEMAAYLARVDVPNRAFILERIGNEGT